MNGTPKMDFVARILIWHVEKEKKIFDRRTVSFNMTSPP